MYGSRSRRRTAVQTGHGHIGRARLERVSAVTRHSGSTLRSLPRCASTPSWTAGYMVIADMQTWYRVLPAGSTLGALAWARGLAGTPARRHMFIRRLFTP